MLKVDCPVFEVGIGGLNDCTNVLTNTPVCGITLLDYDHTTLLGETIEEIAYHKAGIMKVFIFSIIKRKPNSKVTTLVQTKKSSMAVLKTQAEKVGVELSFHFNNLRLN